MNKEFLNKLAKYKMLNMFTKNLILDSEMENINLSETEINEAISLYKESLRIDSDIEFENHKKRMNYDDKSFKYNIELPMKKYKFCKMKFGDALYTNYLKYKSLFDIVTYSIIRLESENISREIYLQLKDDKRSFSDIVLEYSNGPERNTRGIVGPVRLNQGHKILQKMILQYKDKSISKPFRIDSTWVIIRVEEFIDAKLDSNIENEIYKIELDNFLNEEIKNYNFD